MLPSIKVRVLPEGADTFGKTVSTFATTCIRNKFTNIFTTRNIWNQKLGVNVDG